MRNNANIWTKTNSSCKKYCMNLSWFSNFSKCFSDEDVAISSAVQVQMGEITLLEIYLLNMFEVLVRIFLGPVSYRFTELFIPIATLFAVLEYCQLVPLNLLECIKMVLESIKLQPATLKRLQQLVFLSCIFTLTAWKIAIRTAQQMIIKTTVEVPNIPIYRPRRSNHFGQKVFYSIS